MSRTFRKVPIFVDPLFGKNNEKRKRKVKNVEKKNQRLVVFDGKSNDEVWYSKDDDTREKLLEKAEKIDENSN